MALPDDVSAAYRRRVLALRAATYRDLLRLWPAFDPDHPESWMLAAGTVAKRDHRRAAGLAVQYAPVHAAASGVDGLMVRNADPLESDRVDTSLRVTSLVSYRKALEAGKKPPEALRISYVRSSGAITRLALDGGRSALMNTAAADPRIAGWRRTGSPQCQWCRVLIGRGTVYRSGDTASFEAHDHCSCGAENVYTTEARGVTRGGRTDRFRTQEQHDANNARIRAYLRDA